MTKDQYVFLMDNNLINEAKYIEIFRDEFNDAVKRINEKYPFTVTEWDGDNDEWRKENWRLAKNHTPVFALWMATHHHKAWQIPARV